MGLKIGSKAELYINPTVLFATTGAAAVETWLADLATVLLGAVRTVTINRERDNEDVSSRENQGYKQYAIGLKDASIEFEMNAKTDDATAVGEILSAWEDGTTIAVAALDGPKATVGTRGTAGNFYVSNVSESQPLTGAVTYTVTLLPETYTQAYQKTA